MIYISFNKIIFGPTEKLCNDKSTDTTQGIKHYLQELKFKL